MRVTCEGLLVILYPVAGPRVLHPVAVQEALVHKAEVVVTQVPEAGSGGQEPRDGLDTDQGASGDHQ